MPLHCSICKAPVSRQDCHRNRYDELICHACQASGVRFSWRRRVRHLFGRAGRAGLAVWLLLAATALLLLGAWLFEMVLVLQPGKLLSG